MIRSRLLMVLVNVTFITPIFAASSDAGDALKAYWVPKTPPRAHYKIDCSFDTAKGLMQGKESIHFENTASDPIYQLAMKWDLGQGRTLQITCNGKEIPFSTDASEDCLLLFAPPKPILPGEKVKFECTFGNVKRAGGDIFSNGTQFIEWHPRLWWGFATHDDFDVKLQKPAGYTIVSSGPLDSKTGYYHADGVRQFGLILCKDVDVIEADANDVHIMCVSSAKSQKCARLLLDTAADVVNFYRDRFGFYPSKCLTIVEGGNDSSGGYPVATNIVAVHSMEKMDREAKSHWQWITAHEIGHQYWSEYVLSKDLGVREVLSKTGGIKDLSLDLSWVMIGLGLYADREYIQARNIAPQTHQAFINYYIKALREGHDTTINRSEEELATIKFNFNNVVIHGKGYSVISALDCILGNELFNKIYLRCLKEYAGLRMGVYEFRSVCEDETGQDLGWFFDQWVNSNRHLSYDISSKKCQKQNGRYVSNIGIKRLGDLKMPVPVAAYFEDGTCQRKFAPCLLEDTMLRFESSAALKDVRIDPDNELAILVPLPEVEAKALKEIPQMPWSGSGQQALVWFNKIKQTNTDVTDFMVWFKLGLLLYDGKFYPESLEAFQRTQSLSEKIAPIYFASQVWEGHVLDLLGRREEAVKLYKKVLETTDPDSMRVEHSQYAMVLDRAWVEERIKKPFERAEPSAEWTEDN
jgi:tetratricopeptide (TPR) repeat protein